MRKNREQHYEIDEDHIRTVKKKMAGKPDESLMRPNIRSRPETLSKSATAAPPSKPGCQLPYDPLATRKEVPRPTRPPQPYNPLSPPAHAEKPADSSTKFLMDLAKLRKTKPEGESEKSVQHMILATQPATIAKLPQAPKEKKVNPKNDPNCAFCFRCQEWHRKDLHMLNPPDILKKAPTLHQATLPSKSSQMTPGQLAHQKAAISHALSRMPAGPPKTHRKTEPEEDDDFDYDDDFIVPDDDDELNYKKHLRAITKYHPESYHDEDFDDRDMEVRDFEQLEREDLRSKAIGITQLLRKLRRLS